MNGPRSLRVRSWRLVCILLNTIFGQCAVFTRVLSGKQEFHGRLERLKYVDPDVEGGLLTIQGY